MKKSDIRKIITGVPLPEDWDKEVFTKKTSFKKRVEYAKQRAKRLGAGSGRIAFTIDYKGKDTVLKVAKTRKGIAQNEVEIEILRDRYAQNSEIFIPMIDYDTKDHTWLHVEKAQKMKSDKAFEKLTGVTPREVVEYTNYVQGKRTFMDAEKLDQLSHNEYCDKVAEMSSAYDLEAGDFSRVANWGVYKGKAVIIDIGLSVNVYKEHYSR